MSDINKIGLKAKDLQSVLNKHATDVKSYNQARREETARLRPLLQQVWAALENGDTVNAFRSKESWAAWYNPTAKNPIRHIQKIIAGPKEKEANSVRVVTLKEGDRVKIGDQIWELQPPSMVLISDKSQPKRMTADDTRTAIAHARRRLRRELRKDDYSSAWMTKYKDAFVAVAAKHLEWVKVTLNKEFQQINTAIYVRQVREEDEKGWTKVGREWVHEDGRTIQKVHGRYQTLAKVDDGEPVVLGGGEAHLIDAMRRTVADMFKRIEHGLISELENPDLKEGDRSYYNDKLESVRAKMKQAGLHPAADELEQALNEVGEASVTNECEEAV